MALMNLKLEIEYDGSGYAGWQRQLGFPTVQQTLEEAVEKLCGVAVPVIGASRTDAGVHALGQVASLRIDTRIPPERMAYALNHLLPPDIRVVSSCEAPEGFHAQYAAHGKRYLYAIYNHRQGTALFRHTRWLVREPLDVDAMRRASAALVGTHDFSAFRASGGQAKTTVRTVTDIRFETLWGSDAFAGGLRLRPMTDEKAAPVAASASASAAAGADDREVGRHILMTVEGTGFLYNMVRIMAGTLADVGRGRIPEAEVADILASCDRRRAGITAPPQGLCLLKVYYEGETPGTIER